MARDHQFEIQYLISLTLAVLGIIASDTIGATINPWTGFVFLLIVGIHLVIFNIYYTFGKAIDIELSSVRYIYNKSRYVWGALTIAFSFFILHAIFAVLFSLFSYCGTLAPILPIQGPNGVDCATGKIIIAYGAPFIIVSLMSVPFKDKILSPFRTLRDINIKIAPDKIRVFESYSEGEPLFIKVENNGKASHEYTLTIDLPESVVARIGESEYEDKIEEGDIVASEGQTRYNVDLRYTGSEMRSGLIEIGIEQEEGSIEKEIEVLLVPQ